MRKTYLLIVASLWAALGLAGPAHADPPGVTVFFGGERTEAPAPCPSAVTVVRRMGGTLEEVRMPLLGCDGRPRRQALVAVSVLARPRELEEAPSAEALEVWARGGDPSQVAEGIRRLHPGLLVRLQRIGEAFEGQPIELLSGYRPSSPAASRHHHARALDLTVRDVDREALRDLVAGFEATGVGWYPNSVFVHIDVRERPAYWVDLSRPGEAPRYLANAAPPVPRVTLPRPEEGIEIPMTREDIDVLQRQTADALAGIAIPEP